MISTMAEVEALEVMEDMGEMVGEAIEMEGQDGGKTGDPHRTLM